MSTRMQKISMTAQFGLEVIDIYLRIDKTLRHFLKTTHSQITTRYIKHVFLQITANSPYL